MGSLRVLALLVLTVIGVSAQPTRISPPILEIVAPPELGGAATQLSRVDPAHFADLALRLGLAEPGPPIRVLLAAEDSDLARATPLWIAGFANSAAAAVVIFPSRSPSYPYDTIEDVLRHEIAHVLIARAARGRDVPRWLHEGLAMSAERRASLGDQTSLAIAAVAGPHEIAALDAEFDAGDRRAARAYAISAAFVRDLVARYGPDFPGDVLSRLAAGESFDRAFFVGAGVPMAEAERVFWRGRWWFQVVPFVTSSLALWMGIVMLALVAVRRRTAHRAELRRRWDEEEALSAAARATETGSRTPLEWRVPAASEETRTDATQSAFPDEERPPASTRGDA